MKIQRPTPAPAVLLALATLSTFLVTFLMAAQETAPKPSQKVLVLGNSISPDERLCR